MMSKKSLTLLSLIGFMFLVEFAWGQEFLFDKWWTSQRLAAMLKLTETHVRQLDELHRTSHGKLHDLRTAVEKAEFDFDNILGQKSILDNEVRMQFDRLQEARTNLANERLRFEVRLREIIGDERLEKLKIGYGQSR